MSILSTRKVLTCTMFAATLLATASAAQARYSYGGVTFLGPHYSPPSHNGQVGNVTFFAPAYTFQGHNGQMGNVTFFGAPPTTLPSHNGQMGNVTFLGGVQPYTYPGHNGQVGNVTYFGYRPAGTVPVNTVPTPGIVPIWKTWRH
ncbi:MAG TPA: hypothetical protein VIY51_27415 [Xanthobacteraceae bacterium]